MYAITVGFDLRRLEQLYPGRSEENALADVKRVLADFAFTRNSGPVFFAELAIVSAVDCVRAVQAVAARHSWFTETVARLELLRIEETSDLTRALHVDERFTTS